MTIAVAAAKNKTPEKSNNDICIQNIFTTMIIKSKTFQGQMFNSQQLKIGKNIWYARVKHCVWKQKERNKKKEKRHRYR